MFEQGYCLARRLAKLDTVVLWLLHMYRPSAFSFSIRNMWALHMSSMWTKAIDPIRAFTADNILKYSVSPTYMNIMAKNTVKW